MNFYQITGGVSLLLFIILRNSFTLAHGKRSRQKRASFIYRGRKLSEILICFLIPALLLTGKLPMKDYGIVNQPGLLLSIAGLGLMFWTRQARKKDWGFMGDGPDQTLFTKGPYEISRHPYYDGIAFTGIGIYMQLNPWFVFCMFIPLCILQYAITTEETELAQKFGAQWIDYTKDTKATALQTLTHYLKHHYF